MSLNLEENYRYRKLALTVLSKALDDICPTFSEEPEEIRGSLFTERKKTFEKQEKELDKEFEQLEKDATFEVNTFYRKRAILFKKIEKSNNSRQINKKVTELEKKSRIRVRQLKAKELEFKKKLKHDLTQAKGDDKLTNQLNKKLASYQKSNQIKIQKSQERYEKLYIILCNNVAVIMFPLKILLT